jgi:hypothetical protein
MTYRVFNSSQCSALQILLNNFIFFNLQKYEQNKIRNFLLISPEEEDGNVSLMGEKKYLFHLNF